MHRSVMKKLIALTLAVCLLAGCMPLEFMRGAYALLSAQSRAVHGDPMDWVLSKEGESRESGAWQYRLLPQYNYAVITGHTDTGTPPVPHC